jgi:GNAT superfamily N-acetyltransferase
MFDRAAVDAALRRVSPGLRRGRPEDGRRIENMLSGFAALEWPDLPAGIGANIERTLATARDSLILVLEDEGHLVGAVAMHVIPDLLAGTQRILIDDLFVDLTRRAHGLGTTLVRGVHAVADTVGAERIFVTLGTDNLKAQKLVGKHGFVQDDDRLWVWTRFR